ncbi:MAG: Mu-like prophage major head subunit gpT family protein, partial [Syntrophales bacterium]|nr:Mu-like prophage major head subunit gpT family protein [Syntrophales bacterium]
PQNVSRDLQQLQAGFNAASFAFALGNSMNIFLSMIYKDFPYREEIFISQKQKVRNFKKIEMVQFGYFAELPSVDPETAGYNDLEPFQDTESAYAIGQKGAILWITRKMVINDNIGIIKAVVARMAKAARLAHAKHVWKFFLNNSVCPDGTPWFSNDHGNLASDALDVAPLTTAVSTLANMTEPGPSGEKIGLDLATLKDWHLVVALSKWDTAVKTNKRRSTFTANDLTTETPNPCKDLFGDHNEKIVSCPFITDVNSWGVVRDCKDVPIVEMSYLNGQEDPELMVEIFPTKAGQFTFFDDKLGYKIRHEYGGALADYRGAYKSNPQ